MTPGLIYEGTVRHRRFTPSQHEFNYRIFMFCFDVASIESTFQNISQVSIEKFNWFTYQRKNYLGDPKIPLDASVRSQIQAKYGISPTGKIYLLTHLTCLGYCFNPISIYFIFNENNDEIDFLAVEVTNTPWSEKHTYLLAHPAKPKKNIYQYQFNKELHVSPFMEMDYQYHFNLRFDGDDILLHMQNYRAGKLDFDATLSLHSVPLKQTSPLQILMKYPLMTYKVTAGIYWQALKLWLKGNAFRTHPKRKNK